MKIGGHLSVAGGYSNALTKTVEIGGNTVQIFSSSPRQWLPLAPTDEAIADFVKKKTELAIDPVYFHASYLINLADKGFIGHKSKERLVEELLLAEKMQIKGTIIHLGSFKEEDKTISVSDEKYQILIKNIGKVLERSTSSAYFIIEDAGSRKIGWSIDEIARIVKDVQDDRVRVCIDTCHMFAAGYDISTPELFEKFFSDFDTKIGLQKLEVFQVNDSKDTLGSFRDRHENIGEGNIPQSTFELLVNHPVTRDIPFILEVPGVDKEGPNKENVDRLKSFIA